MQDELLGIIEEDAMVERSVKRCERWARDLYSKDMKRFQKEFVNLLPEELQLRLHSIRYILSEFTEDACEETIRVSLTVCSPDCQNVFGRYNCDFNMYGGMDNSCYKKENASSQVQG
ncbi:MAG: hypothetical protein IJT77_07860 [Clostridia bacterium]|nr:hypothetical protein [Clostridia bacterium]